MALASQTLDPELLRFARNLRREQTDAENFMWMMLRNRRFFNRKFRCQHPIKPYSVDFFCSEERLAIELDGGQHADDKARALDAKRTSYLEEQGIRALRFWNNQVFTETEGVLQVIFDALSEDE